MTRPVSPQNLEVSSRRLQEPRFFETALYFGPRLTGGSDCRSFSKEKRLGEEWG